MSSQPSGLQKKIHSASDRPIDLREQNAFLSSLAGLEFSFAKVPALKTLGYCQGKRTLYMILARSAGRGCCSAKYVFQSSA